MITTEAMLALGGSLIGALFTAGTVWGVTREQTKALVKGHAELKADVKAVEDKVDRCVTKSDFPAFFIREKMASDHNGRGPTK